jgi:WD40 repeat protein
MKKKYLIVLSFLGVIIMLIAMPITHVMSVEPITSCEPIGDASPLCGWQNPEDMVALPDGRHVIVSEYGDQSGSKAGMISLLDLETETRLQLYDGGSTQVSNVWGEASCMQVASGVFSPHGIHLSQRADGALQLFVVQHGERESIEMFEVLPAEDSWQVDWRGCVVAPENSMINDVVGTPDGAFLVTHMMANNGAMLLEFIKGYLLGEDTGHVITWHPTDGFGVLANSSGIVPNGIQISDDTQHIFVNYSNGELRRINRLSGELEASNDNLPPLDNATWSQDGKLLLAGGSENVLDMMAIMAVCSGLETGICPVAHVIIEVDPGTLESELVYEGGPNTPGGTGTVALQVDDGSLLIGTFAGDRIVRVAPQ